MFTNEDLGFILPRYAVFTKVVKNLVDSGVPVDHLKRELAKLDEKTKRDSENE